MKTKRKPKVKIRKHWGPLNPVTRVKDSAKRYSRKAKHPGWDLGGTPIPPTPTTTD